MLVAAPPTGKVGSGRSAQLREALRKVTELPPSLRVVVRALELLDQRLCTNEALQEVLVADPATAAGLLRLANSAYFGVRSEIQTVATAVRVVGHRRLKALLQHFMLGKMFETLAASTTLASTIRNAALAAGVVCHEIGEQSIELDGDELRIVGLTHNLAEMAICCEAPELYAIAAQNVSLRSRYAESKRLFGVGFAEINRSLLGKWRFPEWQVNAAENWSRPSMTWPQDGRRYTAAAFVGAMLAAASLEAVTEADAISRIPAGYARQLGADAELLAFAYRQIPEGTRKLEELLDAA